MLSGKLTGHLNQVDREAREAVERLVEQLAKKQGVTDKMKEDLMEWVSRINNILERAEEVIKIRILYI